jgi:patatin-like phospholipase
MSAPLHLSEVLEEEYAVLSGRALPAEERSWLLRPEQVRDPAALLARLRDPSAPGSRAIWARIQASRGEPGDAAALVAALNALLQEPRVLYDVEPARDLGDEELATLLAQQPAGEDLVHVNRLLLDAACRGTIVPVHQARLVQAWRRMHAAKHAALCLSGGGIRSATFALGVLQGLARAGLLGGFHYLSTVSGGGFIGSWLAVWGHRHPEGAAGAVAALAARPEPGLTPEPRPIHRLREYSNYLSPRLGILSADTWVLGATYLRNLLLNWLVLVPVLVAVLAVPRLLVALYGVEPRSAGRLELLLVVGFLLNVLALAYIGYERPSYRTLRRTGRQGRGQGEFLVWCLAPLVGSALLFTIYWSWRGTPPVSGWDWAGFAGFGILLHLTAFCVYSWCLRRLNWTELIVIVGSGALGGLAGGVLADTVLPRVEKVPLLGATLAVPLVLGAVLVAATLFVGLASRGTTDEDREW